MMTRKETLDEALRHAAAARRRTLSGSPAMAGAKKRKEG